MDDSPVDPSVPSAVIRPLPVALSRHSESLVWVHGERPPPTVGAPGRTSGSSDTLFAARAEAKAALDAVAEAPKTHTCLRRVLFVASLADGVGSSCGAWSLAALACLFVAEVWRPRWQSLPPPPRAVERKGFYVSGMELT